MFYQTIDSFDEMMPYYYIGNMAFFVMQNNVVAYNALSWNG